MNTNTYNEQQRMEKELNELRAQETAANREWAKEGLHRRYPDMTDEEVARLIPAVLDKRRLRKLAKRERARLAVIRWQQDLLLADENRDPMYLAIPANAIHASMVSLLSGWGRPPGEPFCFGLL